MKKHLRRWGALYLLAVLALVSLVLYWHYEHLVVMDEAAQHGQPFSEDEFRHRYWSGVYENLQSEWLQLLLQGLLFAGLGKLLFLKEKEDDEEMKARLARIEHKLDQDR